MNIVIYTGYYYPHIGGYEKNIHELAKRLVSHGHRVRVLTCNTEKSSICEIKDGVTIIRTPCWHLLRNTFPVPKPTIGLIKGLFVTPRNFFDIVITQTRFFPICFIGLLFSKIKGLPLIHVERGTCHSMSQNRLVGLIAQIYDHTIGTLIVKCAKVNIGISKSACMFVGHLGGSVPRLVIYNGIEMADNILVHFKSEYKMIVYVGRLVYAKGVQDLIKAFEICCKSFGNLRLIIIGDGNYREELEKIANKSEFSKQIQFLGEVEHGKILDIISVCDIFVNPSYSEGLPTSVIEAARIGLPIVATNVGGTNEIIEDGKLGTLIEPHDIKSMASSILKYLQNKNIAKEHGDNARKGVDIITNDKFNWDKITNQYIEILNKEIK